MKEIRLLRADEIEVRVQSVKDNGGVFLLYKDARCDMRILDETFGVSGWQRSHDVINGNLFCTVEIWDSEKGMWIRKQDVGTESNTEKEKGQASDSFKRACFNIGIGRELYTAPFTWIALNSDETYSSSNKTYLSPKVKFYVKEISCDEKREIANLVISDNKGRDRFIMKEGIVQRAEQPKPEAPKSEAPSQTIFDMIKSAKSIPVVTEIWNSYPQFHRHQEFKNQITIKGNELKSEPQPAS